MPKVISGPLTVLGLVGALAFGAASYGSGGTNVNAPAIQALFGLLTLVCIVMFFVGALFFSRGE